MSFSSNLLYYANSRHVDNCRRRFPRASARISSQATTHLSFLGFQVRMSVRRLAWALRRKKPPRQHNADLSGFWKEHIWPTPTAKPFPLRKIKNQPYSSPFITLSRRHVNGKPSPRLPETRSVVGDLFFLILIMSPLLLYIEGNEP
jgi:hypothetical protein